MTLQANNRLNCEPQWSQNAYPWKVGLSVISLHPGLNKISTLLTGSVNLWENVDQLTQSRSWSQSCHITANATASIICISSSLLCSGKTTMMISGATRVALSTLDLAGHLYKTEWKESGKDIFKIGSNAVYIASAYYAAPLVIIASLIAQSASELVEASSHLIDQYSADDTDWLIVTAAVAQLGLAVFRGQQAYTTAKLYFPPRKNTYVVTTFNTARNWDYRNLLLAYERDGIPLTDEQKQFLDLSRPDPDNPDPLFYASHERTIDPSLRNYRNSMGRQTINSLAEETDIFIMQEVTPTNYERQELGMTTDSIYQEWFQDQNFDSALHDRGIGIAWNKDKFQLIEGSVKTDTTGSKPDWMSVELKDTSEKVIRVVSYHIPGFDLGAYRDNPIERTKIDATLFGPKGQATQLAQMVDTLPDTTDYTFIGSDMNADPSIFNGYHTLLEDRGFTYERTANQPTNFFTPEHAVYPERQLDFIFARGNSTDTVHVSPIDTGCPFKNATHPSDHLPIKNQIAFEASWWSTMHEWITRMSIISD